MHTKVVIFGAIGTAVSIAEQIWDAQSRFGMDIEVLGFAFDDPQYQSRDINGWKVLCGTKEAYGKYINDESVKFVFALYSAKKMEERVNLLHSYGIPSDRFLTFVHPSSFLCKSVKLDNGVIILSNCSISSNTKIGSNTIIMPCAYIGHDVCIDKCNFIGPRSCIGSFSHLGVGNFTGINSNIRSQKEIGKYNIIGMASNLVKSIGDYNIMVGNPAKPMLKD
jgi:sugar O-acyltransferase (sialic acid O-acetyltransferase NeuD family)